MSSVQPDEATIQKWVNPDSGKTIFTRCTQDNLEQRTVAAAELYNVRYFKTITAAAKMLQVPYKRLWSRLQGCHSVKQNGGNRALLWVYMRKVQNWPTSGANSQLVESPVFEHQQEGSRPATGHQETTETAQQGPMAAISKKPLSSTSSEDVIRTPPDSQLRELGPGSPHESQGGEDRYIDHLPAEVTDLLHELEPQSPPYQEGNEGETIVVATSRSPSPFESGREEDPHSPTTDQQPDHGGESDTTAQRGGSAAACEHHESPDNNVDPTADRDHGSPQPRPKRESPSQQDGIVMAWQQQSPQRQPSICISIEFILHQPHTIKL
ncbi:hypothetical protein S7711_11418 [Stachybotrys chartarum IBT 7711]|uniref:Uncharacterized protein n=1 Tax=Stachybotrys chartarum (strain CBS 109288 / IBT 7711) TaxID=1280523 RepID=A0A084BBC2_STACB|nr:hypothetical protein S7711_11418 [Stachybotrys chartarum IBT 7711]